MKTRTKFMAALFAAVLVVSGCSSNNDKTDGKENQTDEKSPVKDMENAVDDSIDNMVSYFDEKKVEVQNMQPIKNMEFAAHEGRSFMVDGKNTYIYRVKHDDENMKKVMNQAKDNGKVKVTIDNKEMEYGARVNGDYLMLYDTTANMNDVLTTFDSYIVAPKGTNAKEGAGTAQNNSDGTTKNPSDGNNTTTNED